MCDSAIDMCDSAANKCDNANNKWDSAVGMYGSAVDVCDSAIDTGENGVDTRNCSFQLRQCTNTNIDYLCRSFMRPPKLHFCGSAHLQITLLMSVVSRCRPNHWKKILYFLQQEIIPLIFIHT
jgi:hypothetical protein